MSNILLTLHAYIAAKLFKPPTRRAIAHPPAKMPRPRSEAAPTIHRPSALFVVQNYQTTSESGRRAIVASAAKTWQQNDGGGAECPPLNREGWHLSQALLLGRELHPLCRQAFTERLAIGFYAYERRYEWRTCALAAAYAGIFGAGEIERPSFSYSQCCWLLSQVLGYNPAERIVEGPTGRRLPVAEEMVALVDQNLWNRRTVAAWLYSVGL